ncbi:Hypothetical predicted protein [Mytilus galloprovincialis]|uniref:Apple domain-containing protein n=1 Tax=Mytilus galloprovincialis TaxID=29158 RepID=A0A8B6ET41_MYTGA|nr:Hypothetical predicted protein [Mytilus galloprovincialis]
MFIVKYVLFFINVFSPAQTESNIFRIHPDRLDSKLQGYIYLTFEKISPRLCFNKCIRRPNCHSYNYNKSLLTCELNNKPKSVSSEDFFFQNGYVYVEIEQYRGDPLLDPCHSKPCKSAEICEIKLDGNTFCVKDNKYTIKEPTFTTKSVKTTTNDNTNIRNTGTSEAQTKTMASISQTIGTATKSTELTSIYINVGTTTKTVDTTAEKHLTKTEFETTVYDNHGPTSDETSHTAATRLLKTTADQVSNYTITNDKPKLTTETVTGSETRTKTPVHVSNTHTIGTTTYDTTMTGTSTSDATITSAKTITPTSLSNTVGTTTNTVGTTEEHPLINTKGTTAVSETHLTKKLTHQQQSC